MAAQLAQAVDGIEANTLDLVVDHVDDGVLGEHRKARRLDGQLTQRVQGSIANL